MMKISICGATGYTGEELLRILASHPQAEIVHITSENQTGADIGSVYPHFSHIWQQTLTSMEQLDVVAKDSDVVFIALPHGHAMDAVKTIIGHGKKVIDLGADYRFADTAVYEKWYKVPHTHKDADAVYGLTELFREEVKQARILANPGCYTTASILALTPLIKNGLVATDSIIVDAKSGISGAGRGLNQTYHYAEAAENLKAYNIGGHRHTPEIEQVLSQFAGNEVVINFTPHLIPMTRGILATCYANLKPGISPEQVDDAFVSHFGDECFIRLLGRGGYPATKNTRGSNYCDISWHVDKRTGRVIVVSALDNLVKGAAGQAVQNMNVMFGIDERAGLTQVPLYL
jgi:N-acetyl-gamma-glutamyl-phosphate reductase